MMAMPLEDSYYAANWRRSTPTGFRMSQTTDAYLPSLWSKEANSAWLDRIRKEKETLGLEVRAFGTYAPPQKSVTILKAPGFVPREQGPLMRSRQRLGSTNHEYGNFHLSEDKAASMSRQGVVRNVNSGSVPQAQQPPKRSMSLPAKAGPVYRRLERLEALLLCQ
mmetsp:Transcript_38072/g.109836  ORF Transcript_38072/g.109836 Transcript_38072/m.109836 type:complete len:165 (-) Transcript_38072:18-512(-)